MRQVKTLQDVNTVLKGLLDFQSNVQTKDQDLHQNRIRNAAPGIKPGDYVTYEQLPAAPSTPTQNNQYFSIQLFSTGAVAVGQQSAPFIATGNRVGQPVEVWVAASQPPTSADAQFNITVDGTNLLATPIVLPIGTMTSVKSLQLVSPPPLIKIGSIILPVVVVAGGAAYVTLAIEILRSTSQGQLI